MSSPNALRVSTAVQRAVVEDRGLAVEEVLGRVGAGLERRCSRR